MTNSEIADNFDLIGDILDFQGANPFRVRAYRNGARTVRDYHEPLANLAVEGKDRLKQIAGIGDDLALKIVTLVTTGNLPMLDDHDRRIIEETRSGTTTYKGSVTGLAGLPDSQKDVGGWEDYPEEYRPPDWDADGDGMPSVWETEHGLDSTKGSDGAQDADRDGYTNLEEYLNELVSTPPKD